MYLKIIKISKCFELRKLTERTCFLGSDYSSSKALAMNREIKIYLSKLLSRYSVHLTLRKSLPNNTLIKLFYSYYDVICPYMARLVLLIAPTVTSLVNNEFHFFILVFDYLFDDVIDCLF